MKIDNNNVFLTRLASAMRARCMRDITCFDSSFLIRSLEKRCQDIGCSTVAQYIEYLENHSAEAATFDSILRVSYTEFFRNALSFAVLEQLVIPSLLRKEPKGSSGEIRIWSAGCATGQEAWSVAMLMDELSHSLETALPYRIIATDISEDNLAQARAGIYTAEAVDNIQSKRLRAHFKRRGESYVIAEHLRKHLDFSCFDLLNEAGISPPASIFGDFDLILCCNLILYYESEIQNRIVNKLKRCLTQNGYLMFGETERLIAEKAGGFFSVAPPAAVFQKATNRNLINNL